MKNFNRLERIEQYGLSPDEKIVVFWTKEIALPHFNRYRVKFRRVWSGRVKELYKFIDRRKIYRWKI